MNYYGGTTCLSAIKQGAEAVSELLATSDGRAQLQKQYNLCAPIVTDLDVATFQGQLMGNVQGVVQYSGDGSSLSRPNVTGMCALATAQTDPANIMWALQNAYGGQPQGTNEPQYHMIVIVVHIYII